SRPAPAAAAARDGLTGPARLLLGSDQRVRAHLIALTLTHGRFTIQRADTAAAAATCITRQLPHLAILDLDLEGLGGERVLERIGFHTLRTARVPVIALTRRGDLKTKLSAFRRGVDDILTQT